jgi:ribosomal protein S18 acetylase RimI-like enzyme
MPFRSDSMFDLDDVLALLSTWRCAEPFDRVAAYPTIYRLGLLLTSRLQDRTRDVRVWSDTMPWQTSWGEASELVGAAALWSRKPEDYYRALEGPFILPELNDQERTTLADEAIIWAKQRVAEISEQRGAPMSLTAVVRQNDTIARDMLTRWGFEPYVTAGNVYWERPLAMIDQPIAPEGFIVGHLNLEDHYVAYEELYGFAQVDEGHRWELARDPEYAHLVAFAPDGALVAYCEVSVCRREWIPGAPRIGWIDYIGAHEDYQRRGLGRAILSAGLNQLRQWGAERVMLVTTPTNAPANALYEAADFTRAGYEDIFRWRT